MIQPIGNAHTFTMRQENPHMRGLAERIVAREAKEHPSSPTDAPLTFRACEKLRPALATLMGVTGSQALLARALRLASADVTWLRDVQVAADGALHAPPKLSARINPHQAADGMVAVLLRLLELLVAFIGETLTRQLVNDTWPQVSVNGDTK